MIHTESARVNAAATKAVLRLGQLWRLPDNVLCTLVGGLPVATLQDWRDQLAASATADVVLTSDQLDRVGCLLGIYKGLHILCPDDEQADAWIKRANMGSTFEGCSALDVMSRGSTVYSSLPGR